MKPLQKFTNWVPPGNCDSDDAINPAELQTLLAVLAFHREGLPAKVREIGNATGAGCYRTAHARLTALQAMGLVDWEKGHGGTIHPTCTLEIV